MSPGFSSILSTSPIFFQVLAPMFQSVAWNVAFSSTGIFSRFCSFTLMVTGRPTIMGSGSTVIRLGSNPAVHGLAMLVLEGPLRDLDREVARVAGARLIEMVDRGL